MQNVGGAERPVRIAQHFAGEEHDIRLPGTDNLVGLGRLGDHTHGASRNSSFAPDSFRERDLVAGADRDLLAGIVASRGDVDEIDVLGAQQTGELHGFVHRKAAGVLTVGVHPVGRGDPDPDRQVRREGGAHGADDLQREAGAVGQAATVLIGAPIGERGKELVGEVPVGGMDFGEKKARIHGAPGGGGEVGQDLIHTRAIQFVRQRVLGAESRGRRSDHIFPACFGRRKSAIGLPGPSHAGFAAGMGELDRRNAALLLHELADAQQLRNVVVAVNAQVAGGDAPLRTDGGRLREHDAGAPHGAAAEVYQVPVGGEAVDRAVLTHGRDHDAVGKRERTLLQWRKESVG